MSDIPQGQPLVEVRGAFKHFGSGSIRVDALADVSMSVFPGEVVGLLGPSGSGKSTLLHVIGCILEPDSGWIRLGEEVVYDNGWQRRDLRRLRLERIGFIFQTHNLIGFLTSTENVAEVIELAGGPTAEARRVAIARALANRPRIVLADEPTAALDSQRAGAVMDLLRKVAQDHQAAVIVVTHDDKIFDRFDRIFRLRDGRLVATKVRADI